MLALAAQPAQTKVSEPDRLEVVAGSLMPAHSKRGITLFAKYRGFTVVADDRGYHVVRDHGVMSGEVVRAVSNVHPDTKLLTGIASPLTNLQRGLVSLT